MRKKYIAANWKMHTTLGEANVLASNIIKKSKPNTNQHIIFFPPFPYIQSIADLASGNESYSVGAQDCASEPKGAFTGEVAAFMIRSVGGKWVIIGHSERRSYFNESNETLKKKVELTLDENLSVMFCCGETIEQREKSIQNQIVETQLEASIFHLNPAAFKNIVIAYEPVWAIGTGKTASPEQAQEMHHYIRQLIAIKYNDRLADEISIVYGGSVTSTNAFSLFSQPDIDGALVGGASLMIDEFISIIHVGL